MVQFLRSVIGRTPGSAALGSIGTVTSEGLGATWFQAHLASTKKETSGQMALRVVRCLPGHAPPPDGPTRAVLDQGRLGEPALAPSEARGPGTEVAPTRSVGGERDADLRVRGGRSPASRARVRLPSLELQGGGRRGGCVPHRTPGGARARALSVCRRGEDNTHSAPTHTQH